MSDTTNPPNVQSTAPAGEIPLEDIDKLLESEDPDFAKSLDEVRAVTPDQDVSIEASAIDEADAMGGEDKLQDSGESRYTKFKANMRMRWMSFRNRLRARLIQAGKDLVIFLKTRPKEFLLFAIATAKVLAKNAVLPLKAFKAANRTQRLAALFLILLCLGSAWVLIHNFKGIWLPSINEPILHSLADNADFTEEFDAKDEGESFYSAFPQESHEFLFPKMKVNLRPSAGSPLPMGAFELIVGLDSNDTSIEVRDREVEFNDLLQRVFEDETFNDLETELGKTKLKSRIKRELNQKLTQGWVKEVSFKTFILKP